MPRSPGSVVSASITLADGTQQTLDIIAVSVTLGGAPLEISFGGADHLHLITDGTDERWYQLVVYPGAANTVTIGTKRIDDKVKPAKSDAEGSPG